MKSIMWVHFFTPLDHNIMKIGELTDQILYWSIDYPWASIMWMQRPDANENGPTFTYQINNWHMSYQFLHNLMIFGLAVTMWHRPNIYISIRQNRRNKINISSYQAAVNEHFSFFKTRLILNSIPYKRNHRVSSETDSEAGLKWSKRGRA